MELLRTLLESVRASVAASSIVTRLAREQTSRGDGRGSSLVVAHCLHQKVHTRLQTSKLYL